MDTPVSVGRRVAVRWRRVLFCREFSKEVQKHQIHPNDGKRHRNRSFAMFGAEIITIMICFYYGSFHNFKHCYLFYVKEHLRKEFPKQLSYNRALLKIISLQFNKLYESLWRYTGNFSSYVFKQIPP